MNLLFDTNAAREYVSKINDDDLETYAKNNAAKFDEQNIYLLNSPIVAMELLSHLSDSTDRDYHVSFKALKAIMLTEEYQKITGGKRYFMEPAECLITRDFFPGQNFILDERMEMYHSFMNKAAEISHQQIKDVGEIYTDENERLIQYVNRIEIGYISEIRKIASRYDASSGLTKTEWAYCDSTQRYLAEIVLQIVYVHLVKQGDIPIDVGKALRGELGDEQKIIWSKRYYDQAGLIVQKYDRFIALASMVLEKVLNGLSNKKLSNYWWDSLLMFHVSDQTINQNNTTVITSDGSMLAAAKVGVCHADIMNYSEFKSKYL